MSGESSTPGRPGYQLGYRLDVSPPTDKQLRGMALGIRPAEQTISEPEVRVATMGRYQATVLPMPSDGTDAPPRWWPLVAARRGIDDDVGLDTALWTRRSATEPAPEPAPAPLEEAIAHELVADKPAAEVRPLSAALGGSGTGALGQQENITGDDEVDERIRTRGILARIGDLEARWVVPPRDKPLVIAVIDTGFNDPNALLPNWQEHLLPLETVTVPVVDPTPPEDFGTDHGTQAAIVLLSALCRRPLGAKETAEHPGFLLRRIYIGYREGYFAPHRIAAAFARAVFPAENGIELPPADLVLIPDSHGAWGMPSILDIALTEAARSGREGRGAVIVCSAGDRGTTQGAGAPGFPYGSAAIGADELAAHPDVVTVSSCDLHGAWLRYGAHDAKIGRPKEPGDPLHAEMGIDSRMAPSLAVSAPGVQVITWKDLKDPRRDGLFDGSSLASTLAAVTVARVLQANPYLSAAEVRRIVGQTAFVPLAVDTPYGAESSSCAWTDRTGHNFKVGRGMVCSLSAALAARDPVCQVLLQVRAPAPPPSLTSSVLAEPAILIARWFDYWVRVLAPAGDPTEAYRRLRPLLSQVVMRSPELREEMQWIARHLMAIFTYDGSHSWFSSDTSQDHGALLRRLLRLTETLATAGRELPDVVDLAALLQTVLARWENDEQGGSRTLENFLIQAFLYDRGPVSDEIVSRPAKSLPRFELKARYERDID